MNPNAWRNLAKYSAQKLDASVASLQVYTVKNQDAQLVNRCAVCVNPVWGAIQILSGILNGFKLTFQLLKHKAQQSPFSGFILLKKSILQDSHTFLTNLYGLSICDVWIGDNPSKKIQFKLVASAKL